MKNISVVPVRAFKDNYIWVIVDELSRKAAAVDPGEASHVANYINNNNLILEAILITHHHHDHAGGIPELKKSFPNGLTVYVPQKEIHKINGADVGLSEGDNVHLSVGDFSVIEIPGHTLGHVAYHGEGRLFTGDTLFSAGCGKVFEGTMEQMYTSLSRLNLLDDDTEIFCGHEYTKNNLQFARLVDPENSSFVLRWQEVLGCLSKNQPTMPVRLSVERATNPFLRCASEKVRAAVCAHAGTDLLSEVEVFANLRRWKDTFSAASFP